MRHLIIILALLVGCGQPVPEQSMLVDEAGNLTLIVELARRGLDLEQVYEVTATWTPPREGAAPVYYRLRYLATGPQDTLSRVTVAGVDTTFTFTVPAYVTRIQAQVQGVDGRGRQGVWGPESQWRGLP